MIKRLLLLFIIYLSLRVLFFIFNHSYFNLDFREALIVFAAGFRFDLVAIAISNAVFISLHIIPWNLFFWKWYQTFLSILFFFINVPAIVFNCIDIAYFHFILKRSSADLLKELTIGKDTGNTLGAMAADYWYILLIAAVLTLFMITGYRKTRTPLNAISRRTVIEWLTLIPSIAIIIISIRGGIQFKPLRIIGATEYTSPQNASLVLNTTFTIIKTYDKDELEPVKYFSDEQAEKIFSPVHQYKSSQPFRKLNVVLIILESMGKEYIGAYNNGKGYTPFLDSLIKESLSFRYSYANSKKSIEGIPAITSSIPALMTEPFITSVYDGNKINSFASLLKQKGYFTAFFHGGNNGTMGFDNFTAAAGYEKYFGRNEYGQQDYDGNWGVYDEPFYKFFVSKMNTMPQPFHTAFFSLSSHHPYTIPPQYKNKFPKGTQPIDEAVGYADYALKTFFENASKQQWFDNTLFVITADHTSEAEGRYYKNKLGIYAVPIIYYMHNSKLKGMSETITQHASVLPGALNYLNYDLPFVCFGESVFDSAAAHFAVNFLEGNYEIIANDYLVQFDGERVNGVYNFKEDSLLSNNLAASKPAIQNEENLLKAVVQQFNMRLIKNQMSK